MTSVCRLHCYKGVRHVGLAVNALDLLSDSPGSSLNTGVVDQHELMNITGHGV